MNISHVSGSACCNCDTTSYAHAGTMIRENPCKGEVKTRKSKAQRQVAMNKQGDKPS